MYTKLLGHPMGSVQCLDMSLAESWIFWRASRSNIVICGGRRCAVAMQMRRLLGHVVVASEHLAMLMLQHAFLSASEQLSQQSPALCATERGERLMSAVIALGEPRTHDSVHKPLQALEVLHAAFIQRYLRLTTLQGAEL